VNSIVKVHALLEECKLRNNPVIIRVNKFDEESAGKFCAALSAGQNTGQPIIPVVVDSYGGQVYALTAMVDAIKASNIPVATIIEGKAMSCGAVLASFGAKGYRFVAPTAAIMIHEVSSGAQGKVEEIKVSSEQTERLNKWLVDSLDKNAGKTPGYFAKLIHEKAHADWYLSPEDLISHGLADHLRIPSFHTTVNVTFELK
jgi:ATP-dependent Clp protease protease subunit